MGKSKMWVWGLPSETIHRILEIYEQEGVLWAAGGNPTSYVIPDDLCALFLSDNRLYRTVGDDLRLEKGFFDAQNSFTEILPEVFLRSNHVSDFDFNTDEFISLIGGE